MQRNHRLLYLLYLLALIKLIIPFFLQDPFFQPHRDEFLYLAEGSHPAWGYMEVPPLLSFFARITHVFGNGMFWIKIWPALFGALTFLLVGRIILSLGGKAFALLLGWLPFMLGVYMRLFFLFQPNFLEVFFWTAIGFCMIRHIQTGQLHWLYLFGISVGLGLMSKYSVAFYTASLFAALLMTRHRVLLLNRHFYYACGVGLLIFLPNLVWQYDHRFPVVFHMKELQDEQLQYINPTGFLVSQLMMNIACAYIWIAGLVFLAFQKDGRTYRPLAWAFVFVIGLLLTLHGKDYYALGAYPALFAFGAVYIERVTAPAGVWLRYVMVAFSLALGLFAMPLIMPMAKPEKLASYYRATGFDRSGSLKWEDRQFHPLPQDFADMMGWREMAFKAASVYHSLPPAERDSTMILCLSYGSAGALTYYGREAGLPEVYSGNASFLFWMPDHFPYRHILLVGHHLPGKDEAVFRQFGRITIKDSLVMPLFREDGMRFILYENGNDSLRAVAERTIAAEKVRFIR
jgi:Dolichyl-phosphate-mannose-protein mannosyltransferase